MLHRIYLWLKSINRIRTIVWLCIVAAICVSALAVRARHFQVPAPDGMFRYGDRELHAFFCHEDSKETSLRRRQIYIATQLTFDTIFPFAYGTLMGLIVVRIFPEDLSKRLVLLPVATTSLDLSENAMLVWLAATWNCGPDFPMLFKIVPWITFAKWMFAMMTLATILVGWTQRFRLSRRTRRI